MPSSLQAVTQRQVFDYIYIPGDATATLDNSPPLKNAEVIAYFNFNSASVTSPVVNIGPTQVRTTTDNNGFWQLNLVPNDTITPSGTTWTIRTPVGSYEISVPSGGAAVQSSSILVNTPSTLSPAVTGLTGPITVTGNETVTGNLTVNGTTTLAGTTTGALTTAAESVGGDLTIQSAFRLLMLAAASKLVPGATSFSVRNNADAQDNLLVSNAGNVTALGSLTSTGGPITATAGDLIATAGRLVLNAAAAKIKGGATSLSLRNNADSADNVLVADAGSVTLRNALSIPPAAAGTVAPTSYGTVPIKYDEQTPSGVASITIPNSGSIPGTFRKIRINFKIRASDAVTQEFLTMRFNGDSGTNYQAQTLEAIGATLTGTGLTSQTSIRVGIVPGASAASFAFSTGWIEIFGYADITSRKSNTAMMLRDDAVFGLESSSGEWTQAGTAITSVTLLLGSGNFVSPSLITTELYP